MGLQIGTRIPNPDRVRPAGGEVRCNGCRSWFSNDLRQCPECDHPRPGFNKRLRTAILDNHLLDQARSADLNR